MGQAKHSSSSFSLIAFLLLAVAVCLSGCGGGSHHAAQVSSVPFQSARALDGSDSPVGGNVSNIWVVNLDGSSATALTSLTTSGATAQSPIFSPDGSQIVFESSGSLNGKDAANTNDTHNVWVTNSDGRNTTALIRITAQDANSSTPVFSPDGGTIAFQSRRALDGSDNANTNITANIWSMNSDGSHPTPLTQITALAADCITPVFSPDGTKILFASGRALDGSDAANTAGRSNIWLMNIDGSSATPLTSLTAALGSGDPVWSPDGTKVAYDSDRAFDGSNGSSGRLNIWVSNANGSGAAPLTSLLVATAMRPAYSPDGTKIAFQSNRSLDGSDTISPNNTLNIWVMNADGSSPTAVTKLTANQANSFGTVIWSANSTQIVFNSSRALDGTDAANSNGTVNIWIINADGTGAMPLTNLTAAGADSFLRLTD